MFVGVIVFVIVGIGSAVPVTGFSVVRFDSDVEPQALRSMTKTRNNSCFMTVVRALKWLTNFTRLFS